MRLKSKFLSKKGQAAIEFALLLSFVLLLVSGFLVAIQKNLEDAQKVRDEELVNQLMNVIRSEILYAEQSGLGYSRDLFLPMHLDGSSYNISSISFGQEIVINYRSKDYIFLYSGNSSRIYNETLLRPGHLIVSWVCVNQFECGMSVDS